MKTTLFLIALLSMNAANSEPYKDPRYCGEPVREFNSDGTLKPVKRSQAAIRLFRKTYPCPTGAKWYEACKEYEIDHMYPIACGGCDAPHNMQYLHVNIKRCKETWCKDRIEQRTYCGYGTGQ